jgi:hypothetical protein
MIRNRRRIHDLFLHRNRYFSSSLKTIREDNEKLLSALMSEWWSLFTTSRAVSNTVAHRLHRGDS